MYIYYTGAVLNEPMYTIQWPHCIINHPVAIATYSTAVYKTKMQQHLVIPLSSFGRKLLETRQLDSSAKIVYDL